LDLQCLVVIAQNVHSPGCLILCGQGGKRQGQQPQLALGAPPAQGGGVEPSDKKKLKKAKRDAKVKGLPDVANVEIGRVHEKLTYIDTPTHFGLHNIKIEKAALAAICGCGLEDKCWGVTLSFKPWPLCLETCNKPGQPGHEKHDSRCHVFSAQQLKRIAALIERQKAVAD
jgi:hypothetical protein